MKKLEVYRKIVDKVSDGVYFLDADRNITFWNNGAEKLSGFTASEVVGSSCADNILCHVDDEGRSLCIGGCPVSATLKDGQDREALVYMHHKGGYRVPVRVNVFPIDEPDGRVTGAVEIFRENIPSEHGAGYIEDLRRSALLDPLTELPNRRSVEMKLQLSLAELNRYDIPFGALFVDIDNFKAINDTYGHNAGDEVLKMVAHTMRSNLRVLDTVGRWGGEEFLVVVAHARGNLLPWVAEKIRILVDRCFILVNDKRVQVTVTVGCASARPEDTVESLVGRADRLMYRGKKAGKNRVVTETDGQ